MSAVCGASACGYGGQTAEAGPSQKMCELQIQVAALQTGQTEQTEQTEQTAQTEQTGALAHRTSLGFSLQQPWADILSRNHSDP